MVQIEVVKKETINTVVIFQPKLYHHYGEAA